MTRRLRAAAVFTLAACALLSGCGKKEAERTADAGVPGDTTARAGARPQIPTVHLQMTGLILIVPSATGSVDSVDVYLPKAGGHTAWLGFGMTADSTKYAQTLCERGTYGDAARAAKICYVDQDKWDLQPLGQGGTGSISLPAGVLNVTDLSGGEHKAHKPWIPNDHRTHFVLRSGKPGNSANSVCRLASWWITPGTAGGGQGTARKENLVNMLDWEITNLSDLTLEFKSKQGDTLTVSLPPPAQNRIDLLLAHVPTGELKDLPPGSATTPLPTPPDTATDFGYYYSLIRKRVGSGTEEVPSGVRRRPLPEQPARLSTDACPAGITRLVDGKSSRTPAALGTYACIVGSATPGP